MLIFKIVPAGEWNLGDDPYEGSAHDKEDGFLHFSTAAQLAETLQLHYAGRNDLLLVAVDAAALGSVLRWDHAPSRGQDFPHLHGSLPRAAVRWVRPIEKDAPFVLPAI